MGARAALRLGITAITSEKLVSQAVIIVRANGWSVKSFDFVYSSLCQSKGLLP